MGYNSRTVINSMIWKLLERLSSQLVSFVISIVLARLLMPEDYGIIAIVLVFISFANVIIDGGLNTALIQKKHASQVDFSTIFWFCLALAIVVYVILFVAAPIIAHFYENDLLVPVLRVLCLIVFFNSFNSIQRAYVARHMLFQKLFYINAVSLVISGSLGITMAYLSFGVWALVAQSLSNAMICCFFMWYSIQWRPTCVFSNTSFRSLFDFGWKIFLTNLIVSIYNNIRSLLIGKVYNPTSLAYFDRGRTLPDLIVYNVTSTLNAVLLPAFSEEQDNIQRVKQMMRRSIKVSYFVLCPLLIGFIVTAKDVVLLLLTEKWLPCVPFIQIFCIAYILTPVQNVNMTTIQSLGYSSITLKLEIIKKILEAVILVISFLINVYAVAWGIVVYNFLCIFINLQPSRKLVNYGTWEQIKDIIPIVGLSLFMGGIVYMLGLFDIPSIYRLSLQIVCGATIYYSLCRIVKLDSLTYVLNYCRGLVRRGSVRNDGVFE